MNNTNDVTQIVIEFREDLHSSFQYRADATMNLIDSIAANTMATSPVELSLNPTFPRRYSSLHDAVDNFFVPVDLQESESERMENQIIRMRIIADHIPDPVRRNFFLFGLDVTPHPRQFAHTLKDRGIQYYPNPAPGNKPIIIGHSYSILAALPEKDPNKKESPWVLPLLARRVPTDRKATQVGAEQVDHLMEDLYLPFRNELCAVVADSAYSTYKYLGQIVKHDNLAAIVRSRGNRNFYRMPETSLTLMPSPGDAKPKGKRRGHPTWYGPKFKLPDPSTWHKEDTTESRAFTFKNGRPATVTIQSWNNMLMSGTHEIPMYKSPFTLIRVTVHDNEGKTVFKRPLWLIVCGERRHEISPYDAYEAYMQRYDLEHFFRFGKNKLLMISYQTPDVAHEENWWEIVSLSYADLFTAAPLAENLPKPWEIYLLQVKESDPDVLPSPSMVQRDMDRIISGIGTPADLPKPRGKSPGRKKGDSPERRKRHPYIKKGKQATPAEARAA